MSYTLTQEERETTIRFDPVEKIAQALHVPVREIFDI